MQAGYAMLISYSKAIIKDYKRNAPFKTTKYQIINKKNRKKWYVVFDHKIMTSYRIKILVI